MVSFFLLIYLGCDGCISSMCYLNSTSIVAIGSGSTNLKHENSITIFDIEEDELRDLSNKKSSIKDKILLKQKIKFTIPILRWLKYLKSLTRT